MCNETIIEVRTSGIANASAKLICRRRVPWLHTDDEIEVETSNTFSAAAQSSLERLSGAKMSKNRRSLLIEIRRAAEAELAGEAERKRDSITSVLHTSMIISSTISRSASYNKFRQRIARLNVNKLFQR